MYSWPSSSAFMYCIHGINQLWIKNTEKMFQKVPKSKIWICHAPVTIYITFTCNYIVVGIVWRRQWHPTPVLLPGKSHGHRSLVGCSPWGCWESGMTEWLHFHFSLSCIGEGNGNPFHYSCLENPRDRGACWAAIYGVTQSRTQLKRFSSSSSRYCMLSTEGLPGWH